MPAEAPVMSTRPTSCPSMRNGSSLTFVRVTMGPPERRRASTARAAGASAAPPLPAQRVGQPQDVVARLGRSDVVREQHEIVQLAVRIGDVPREQCLGAEAELLEDGDGAVLVDRHLRDKLLQPALEG